MAGARRILRSNSHKASQQDKTIAHHTKRSEVNNSSKGRKSVAGGKRAKRVSPENGVVEDLERLDAAPEDDGNAGTPSFSYKYHS